MRTDDEIYMDQVYEGEVVSLSYERYVEEEYDRWCEEGLRKFEEHLDYESYRATD